MRELVLSEVTEITAFSEGQRVLIDFMEAFDESCFMLIGNTYYGLLAVVCENHETPNYKPRRFRFNIGSLHQYVLVDDDKLCYADELKSGDTVYVGSRDEAGNSVMRKLLVARVKKEIRPFVKIICKYKDSMFSAILQTDATTALLGENGIIPLSDIRSGSMIYTMPWGKASHLGNSKEEFCEEY